ncbi:MAG: hypothetical protein IPL46_11985 [Saprospiraceae bacterium]|nr:hypothetical protein [Saprospiraceae bacterium]
MNRRSFVNLTAAVLTGTMADTLPALTGIVFPQNMINMVDGLEKNSMLRVFLELKRRIDGGLLPRKEMHF